MPHRGVVTEVQARAGPALRDTAQAYLDGPLFAMLRGNPAVNELSVRGWAVDVELGARTRATPAHAR